MTSGAARQRAELAKEIYESASREAAFAGTSAGNVLAERLAESELGHAALSDRVVALESDQAARIRGAFKLQDALTVAEERVAELEKALAFQHGLALSMIPLDKQNLYRERFAALSEEGGVNESSSGTRSADVTSEGGAPSPSSTSPPAENAALSSPASPNTEATE